ncbi:hypothetical protein LPJ78_001515 [Coemansia sp. RSA 989]|nr:hypothetical protein LPJ78_001515 [Coemansia sp. RSA 989]
MDEKGEDYEDEAEEQTGLADLEFISIMVQHLSWVLVTAPETESLRLTLRRYSAAVPLSAPGLPSLPMVPYLDVTWWQEHGPRRTRMILLVQLAVIALVAVECVGVDEVPAMGRYCRRQLQLCLQQYRN